VTPRSCGPWKRWSAARRNGRHFKEQRSNAFKKLINHPTIPQRGLHVWRRGAGQELSDGLLLYGSAVVRKTRLHFHEFMREVHRELTELQGTCQPAG
jgi:cell division protein ZapE